MLGAGGALLGVGTLFTALGSKEKAAHQQLAQAITNTGGSYETYAKQIDEAIKHQEKFGNSSVQTQNALQQLTQATHSPTEALKLLSVTSDVAASKHEDLSQAALDVGKVYNGNTKLLKEYGVVLDKHTHLTKNGQTATEALAGVVRGQAAAAADTFNGKLKAVTTTIEDQVSQFGEKYGPALQGAGAAMSGLAAGMQVGSAAMEAMRNSTTLQTAATYAWAAAETVAEAAGAPLWVIIGLIIAAVAALIAVAYVLYRNWTTIWAAMHTVVRVVWDWIKTNWPLLVGILLGPITLAAALIYKYGWAQILGGVQAVWNWIRGAWGSVYSFLAAPIGAAAGAVIGAWTGVVNFFAGLPSTIGRFFGQVVAVIVNPFRWAFDAIANLWNSTVGALSFKVPGWIPGVGGKGFSMPKIPTFQTGGIMPYTGLALLHKDETVIPAGAGRTGPALVIQHATFTNDVDVDLLMRRAAWAVQVSRI
jgi:hypothetical protein